MNTTRRTGWLLSILLGAGLGASTLWAQEASDGCVSCHRGLDEEALAQPVRLFEQDVHAAEGFGCVDCHGGDPAAATKEEAKGPGTGYVGKPARQQIAESCGSCHSDAAFMRQYNPALRVDQVAEYLTSVHGIRLVEEDDPNVATCVGCHVAHSIKPAEDPTSSVHPLRVPETCGACHADDERMEPYGIATNQLERYRESVHWEALSVKHDLSAPTCNDCHGNHGASPPGVGWVGNVCGQCHAVTAELFNESVHAEYLEELDTPGCQTCHNNHAIRQPSDELLGVDDEAICSECHLEDDEGGEAAIAMRALIDSLRVAFEVADSTLTRAETAGMEVSQAQFELNDALSSLVTARTAIHAFAVERVEEAVNEGLEVTDRTRQRGLDALAELRFRRAGLAVSTVIILTLVVGLLLKIRDTEARVGLAAEAVRTFFYESMLASGATRAEGVGPEDLRLAACAVLLELAYADRRFAESERRHLERLIREKFALDREEARTLVELADQQRTEAGDISQFTGLIAHNYGRDEKLALLKDMWSLVLSDGELASREEYLMARITRMLGMDPSALDEIQSPEKEG
ncbi:MAG: TerB family tellurite resistance protein [Gemmatimonadota bacterium]|nr:MAG: TerB family tellurite resistance protein [Gemmatimonadota bacterium]